MNGRAGRFLPKQIRKLACLLGAGALVGMPAARADIRTPPHYGAPDASRAAADGAVLIRLNEGKVQISDRGARFVDLPDQQSAELAHLRQLLRRHPGLVGSSAVMINPFLVADGAGGVQWVRPPPAADQAARTTNRASAATADAGPRALTAPPAARQAAPAEGHAR